MIADVIADWINMEPLLQNQARLGNDHRVAAVVFMVQYELRRSLRVYYIVMS